jgi:phage terminase large subunit-like protein
VGTATRPDLLARTPILDVEQAIRDACRRWQVRAIVCDPFRWQRSMQVLLDDGLPVEEFAQTAQRMTPATNALYEAVVNRTVTHSGDPRLNRHVGNATVRTDSTRHPRRQRIQTLHPSDRPRRVRDHGARRRDHRRHRPTAVGVRRGVVTW